MEPEQAQVAKVVMAEDLETGQIEDAAPVGVKAARKRRNRLTSMENPGTHDWRRAKGERRI